MCTYIYIYILCYVSTYFYDILNRARLNFYTGMLNYKVDSRTFTIGEIVLHGER